MEAMRELCPACHRPAKACLCAYITKFETHTHFVILMHPKEFKKERVGTGRLSHASLPNSQILWDENFTENKRVNQLIADPANFCVLMYPGESSLNVSKGEFRVEELAQRKPVVFLLDGTWACAKKMLKLSTNLQELPRLMFTPTAPSQFFIKNQPHAVCLSTIETIHQFLASLSEQGFEDKQDWDLLLKHFFELQRYQIEASQDPARNRYRPGKFKTTHERRPFKERTRKLFY